MSGLRLYHYWRSSSSWRVRWAFALKGITYEAVPVSLLNGESESPEHLARHPAGFVPVLEFMTETRPERRYLVESLAIIDWAEQHAPSPSLFPSDPYLRARSIALAEVINSGTHPLQNLPVQEAHSSDPDQRKEWARRWIRHGLGTYESLVQDTAGRFSVGDQVTLADLCLVPQCYNALRYDVPMNEFPTIARIRENLLQTKACQASEPDCFKPADA